MASVAIWTKVGLRTRGEWRSAALSPHASADVRVCAGLRWRCETFSVSSALYSFVIMLGSYLGGAVGAWEWAGCRRFVVLRLVVVGALLRPVAGPGGTGAGGSDS